ncbi:MAG: hypothetical protein QNJ98_01605 [Planctomycetota bacterium]|nr:hypothetical protein [Planctomycetota bacterium]
MPSALLYYTYAAVMVASLGCFAQAYRTRLVTPVHKRWGIAGAALSLGGIVVVLIATYVLGWIVDQRLPDVVRVHRLLALAATALVLLIAISGWQRWRIHTRLYIVFFPLYIATVATALIGYTP